MNWVIALLPWFVVIPALIGFAVRAQRSKRSAERALGQAMRQHFGDQVAGNTEMPWTWFHAEKDGVRASGPGDVTTGMVTSGLMRVDAMVSLPDQMVVTEGLRVMLFGLNGTQPIPTGTPAFDATWRVTPLTGATGQMAPAGAYLRWARPDVLEALRRLDFPLMQVVSGQLTLTLPSVHVGGVDLAMRTARTIAALSRGQSPPALMLPLESLLVPKVIDNSGPSAFGILGAGLVLFGLPSLLVGTLRIPGSQAIACPDGGEYGHHCRHSFCYSSRRSPRYEEGCATRGPAGLVLTPPSQDVVTLDILWVGGGLVALLIASAGIVANNRARVARQAWQRLEQGSRGE